MIDLKDSLTQLYAHFNMKPLQYTILRTAYRVGHFNPSTQITPKGDSEK